MLRTGSVTGQKLVGISKQGDQSQRELNLKEQKNDNQKVRKDHDGDIQSELLKKECQEKPVPLRNHQAIDCGERRSGNISLSVMRYGNRSLRIGFRRPVCITEISGTRNSQHRNSRHQDTRQEHFRKANAKVSGKLSTVQDIVLYIIGLDSQK